MNGQMNVSFRVRAYVVDENDQLRRIPCAHYRRIRSGGERVYLYAGRTIRFVETCMKETGKGQPTMTFACFPLVYFDGEGRSSQEQRERELQLSEKMMQSGEQSGWREVFRAQRDAEFRWRPTKTVLEQLRDRAPLPKT